MKKMLIKVCGMREPDNIRRVEALGVDLMGFICWEKSPRHVDGLPSYLPTSCKRVGVFVNTRPDYIKERTETLGLDAVQLHGQESPADCMLLKEELARTSRPVELIKAFSIKDDAPFPATAPYEPYCDLFIFDTRCTCVGGSGRTFDWNRLREYHGHTPFLLSGGIGEEQLRPLQAFSHPMWAGVDLNSRFETAPGLKDVERLRAFIGNVREQPFLQNTKQEEHE